MVCPRPLGPSRVLLGVQRREEVRERVPKEGDAWRRGQLPGGGREGVRAMASTHTGGEGAICGDTGWRARWVREDVSVHRSCQVTAWTASPALTPFGKITLFWLPLSSRL